MLIDYPKLVMPLVTGLMEHRIKYELFFSAKQDLMALQVEKCNKQANFCNKLLNASGPVKWTR